MESFKLELWPAEVFKCDKFWGFESNLRVDISMANKNHYLKKELVNITKNILGSIFDENIGNHGPWIHYEHNSAKAKFKLNLYVDSLAICLFIIDPWLKTLTLLILTKVSYYSLVYTKKPSKLFCILKTMTNMEFCQNVEFFLNHQGFISWVIILFFRNKYEFFLLSSIAQQTGKLSISYIINIL